MNEEIAMEAVERSWRKKNYKNNHGQPARRAYLCDECGWWHLTSAPERVAVIEGELASQPEAGSTVGSGVADIAPEPAAGNDCPPRQAAATRCEAELEEGAA